MAIWIYPNQDKKFLSQLLEAYKEIDGWENTRIWQNNFEEGKYPQYLASLDPRGVGGDTCHLWRDGQTWWPMTGDFSFDEEEQIEIVLRKCIENFLKMPKALEERTYMKQLEDAIEKIKIAIESLEEIMGTGESEEEYLKGDWTQMRNLIEAKNKIQWNIDEEKSQD